jgi:hypothetical protein
VQRDDRLARLAETHVVGEDRAPAPQQEGDSLYGGSRVLPFSSILEAWPP